MKVRTSYYAQASYAVVETKGNEYHFRLEPHKLHADSLIEFAVLQRKQAARLLKLAAIAEEASTRI